MTDLILIPGLLCDERLWAKEAESLRGVARCHVADVSTQVSIAAMAESVVTDAPERFALAGFSMGGLVALEVFARASERISHLALLSTNASGILPQVRQNLQNAIGVVEQRGLDAYLQDVFPKYMAPAHAQDVALWETFSSMGRKLGPIAVTRHMGALLEYPGFSGSLENIDCPVVLICGGEDQRTPVAVHTAMASKICHAQLRIMEGSGHFTPLEAPEGVSAALAEWLRQ